MAPPPRLRNRVALLALIGLIGCEGAAPDGPRQEVGVETIDGVEVAWNVGPGMWGADPIDAEPFLSIGELEGDPEYLFGAIAGVAVDGAGRIYVLDQMASEVRVYGTDGRFLTRIGKAGEGPGEFRQASGIAFDSAGDLVVRDLARVTRFAASERREIPLRPAATWAGLIYPPGANRTARVTSEGEYLYPRDHHPQDGPSRYFYVRFSTDGEVLDTLPVPDFAGAPHFAAWFRTGPGGGRMLTGLNYPPFHPLPFWDATARGTVLSGDGRAFVIIETGARGDTIRRIERRGLAPDRIPAPVRNDSLAAVRSRLDSIPVPLDQVMGLHEDVRAGRVPETYPAYVSVHAAADGWIWAERWPDEGRTRFDVFSERGRYLGTVRLPLRIERTIAPVLTREAIYGVVVDSETEVQRVVGFRFSMP